MARSTRQAALALGLSLAVHGLVLLAIATAGPAKSTQARAEPLRVPLEMRWLETTERGPPVRHRSSSASTPRHRRPPEVRHTDVPLDLHRGKGERVNLGGVSSWRSAPMAEEPRRGRTLSPEDAPTEAEGRVEEGEQVEARLRGFLTNDLAVARARSGLVPPELSVFGQALRDATMEVPKLVDTDSPKEVATAFTEAWGAGAARYGATGAPYAEPEGRWEASERPSALVQAADRGNAHALALLNWLYAGARVQEFADGRAGVELGAMVEIKHRGSGVIDSVQLVRPSGHVPFDTWVTERAHTVAKALAADAGTGLALRSVWRFDGIMKFRRKLKLTELDGRALLGVVTTSALSGLLSAATKGNSGMPAMVGRLDPATGEVDLVDFSNPTYDCKVTLFEFD